MQQSLAFCFEVAIGEVCMLMILFQGSGFLQFWCPDALCQI